MAIKNVIRMGHPTLREIAQKMTPEEILSVETKELIQDMFDTMKEEGGIGIAAPQIGVSKQVAIIQVDSDSERYPEVEGSQQYIIFNPEIEIINETLQGFWEGCLSVPGLRGFVERPCKVKINYLNERAQQENLEVQEFLATVFQHELDHLFGILYIDRVQDTRLLSYNEEFDQFISNNEEDDLN